MRIAPLLALALLAGCVSNAPSPDVQTAAAPPAAAEAPTSVAWKGHVVSSELDAFSHVEPSEQVLFSQQQEGFLFDFKEVPEVLQVSLDWKDPSAKMMIMLHSHKEHGTNVYDEHISKLDATRPKCIQVPPEDFSTGEWQVMVHAESAVNVDFTLTVTMVGGAGQVVKDKMHGHNLQDGDFKINERKVEPCAPLGA